MAKQWQLAKSLETLRKQINDAFPNRSKASDGTVGDLRHQASASDHNPNPAGVVTAMDITHDPAKGVDCHKLAAALQASKDTRIKYLIFDGRITQKGNPQAWKKYTGKNAHKQHLHVSVNSDPSLYDYAAPWKLDGLIPAKPAAVTGVRAVAKSIADAPPVGSAYIDSPAPAPWGADREIQEIGRRAGESLGDQVEKTIPAIPPLPVSVPAIVKSVAGATGGLSLASVAAAFLFLRDNPEVFNAVVTLAKWLIAAFAVVGAVGVAGVVYLRGVAIRAANELNAVRFQNAARRETADVEFDGWKSTRGAG
ncbi:MAG TPA: hypothetical protein VK421_06155 [Pyrinomonadaceae bacterium]|nr:hypothetical protein [Pyrinomonadaceae bacterium]